MRAADPGWEVRETEAYVHDQRLLDPRVEVTPLSARLGSRSGG